MEQGAREEGTSMSDLQVFAGSEASESRDNELRAAHQEAFERIRVASGTPGYHQAVSEAVHNLIDACEAYCRRRSEA
jgi:hypothetical protein